MIQNTQPPKKSHKTLWIVLVLVGVLVVLPCLIGGIVVAGGYFLASSSATRNLSEARIRQTRAEISNFEQCLDLFETDCGRYPTTSEGLDALLEKPGQVQGWHGPYLKRASIPVDPWGNPYNYQCPGSHNMNTYDLWSNGPSDQSGSGGKIGNFDHP